MGIGAPSSVIKIPYLRHLVSEVGDKIKPETFDKILKGGDLPGSVGIKGDTCTLDELLTFLQKLGFSTAEQITPSLQLAWCFVHDFLISRNRHSVCEGRQVSALVN